MKNKINKYIFFVIAILIGIWVSILAFNNINPYLGIGLFLAIILVTFNLSFKQNKTK